MLGRRDEIRATLNGVEKQRHETEQAEAKRRERLGKNHPSGVRGQDAEAIETQRLALDHARARLKATEEKLVADLKELDERRRPFVQSQRRMVNEIDKTVKRQHQLHLDPTLPLQEPTKMEPTNSNAFRHAAAPPSRQPAGASQKPVDPGQKAGDGAKKPLASVARLNELKKQLDKAAPALEFNPPGMTPDVGKHVRDNKAIGDEITRIQQALANRRGQADDAFKRSAGG